MTCGQERDAAGTAILLHDDNEDKMAVHGITPRQLDQALASPFVVKRNRRGRRAPYFILGVDGDGNCLAAPIEPTGIEDQWRPVTAWYCKPYEWSRL